MFDYVFLFFGLVVGYFVNLFGKKLRLLKQVVYYENMYNVNVDDFCDIMNVYD